MNTLKIHRQHILFNAGYLHGLRATGDIFPEIKSNAYGHGLEEMVQILEPFQTPYLVVDSLPEYFRAKKHTKKKFLLQGETNPANYIHINTKRVTIAVYNIETLKYLLQVGKKFTIHVFLNTGMHREGIEEQQLGDFLQLLQKHENRHLIDVEGVMSHLAEAEVADQESMKAQVETFKKMYYQVLDQGHNIRYRHIGNSAALMALDDNFFNAWRPGLALYGYNPFEPKHPKYDLGKKLKPACTLTSTVTAIQHLTKGQGVGYNKTRIAPKDTVVAAIPFGYKEGFPRTASNKIVFFHGQTKLAQVGTISMNHCSLDCGKHHVKVGDEIELISPSPDAPNTFEKLAKASETIVYECLVRLDPMMRREIVG